MGQSYQEWLFLKAGFEVGRDTEKMDACKEKDDKVVQVNSGCGVCRGNPGVQPSWGTGAVQERKERKNLQSPFGRLSMPGRGTELDLLGTGSPGKVSPFEKGEGYLLGY